MSDNFSILDSAQRATLIERQRLERLADSTYQALSTGRRVSSVSDNPVDFYRAQSLSDRISDLSSAKSTIEQEISSFNAAQTGLNAIENISLQLAGIANSARGADPEALSDVSAQFDRLRGQIVQIASDTSYAGQPVIDSADIEAAIGTSANYNGFADLSDVTAALNDIQSGIEVARGAQTNLGNDIATLQIQEDFNRNFSNTLEEGVGKLINADLNEQAANALSLQLRDSLSIEALNVLAQSQNQLLGLVQGA